MRIIFNLFKALLHLAVAGFLGYYNYTHNQQEPYNGALALGTSVCFLLIGMSMVLTWVKKEKRLSEQLFARQCLGVTDTAARSVDAPVKTAKAATNTSSVTSAKE